jgi:hypothetical protein
MRLDASRITGGTHLIVRQPRVLRRCSTFGRREFWDRRWRRRERSPTVLAENSHRQDRQGFPWPFERLRRAAPARESLRRSRCCSRRRWRRASRAGAGRHDGYARHGHRRHGRPGHESPAQSRSHRRCHLGSRLVRRPNSRRAGRRRPARRRPLWHPGISENRQISPGNRGNLFAGGAGGTAKLVPGNRRSPCSITGKRPARFRGRDASPGDDHPDDYPHRLEWPRHAPQTGYNYATAADISLTLNQPAPAPPPAHAPGGRRPRLSARFSFLP